MNDIIRIVDLEVFAKHGVLDEEQKLGQKFLFSADICTDIQKAALYDDIELSTNYAEVCQKIVDFNKENTFRLIETAAVKTCELLLSKFPLIDGIKIEIKKPWAPVGLPLKYVSVKAEKKWHNAFVAFGSNMGDRESYINSAINELKQTKGCKVIKVSDVIQTKPYGNTDQQDFLNGVMMIRTFLEPEILLDRLHEIENNAGRKRTVHWGPRTLDLDIILYDDIILDSESLTIPHYDMHRRRFVLEPLAQIAPFVRHPVLKKTAIEMLKEIE